MPRHHLREGDGRSKSNVPVWRSSVAVNARQANPAILSHDKGDLVSQGSGRLASREVGLQIFADH